MKKLFGQESESGGYEYPEVDSSDERYTETARQPGSQESFEVWRFEDEKCLETREVQLGNQAAKVHSHFSFPCNCPEHGDTYLVECCSPPNWPQPSGKGWENRWGIRMGCGCVWISGGRIGGGNTLAGFYKEADVQFKPGRVAAVKTALPSAAKVAVKRVPVRLVSAAAPPAKKKTLFDG